jgi:two-component system sensor histidine kinase SenX3
MLFLLRNLPGTLLLLDESDRVPWASSAAIERRLVRGDRLAFRAVADCAAEARARNATTIGEVSIPRPPLRLGDWDLRVRAIPLGAGWILLLVDDLTEENRVAAVRRDFIANVSHELKTPVGAVSLLSEAIVAARDDPEAVRHFAEKMQAETERLTSLIQDVIDLSRLQGDDPMEHATIVPVGPLVDAAVEFVRGAAEAKSIPIIISHDSHAEVYGDAGQLETAVRNVLSNAIAYSPAHTQVAVSVRARDLLVEIVIRDQGIGIPENELDRIFERFYRVDAARSRMTGGTGLGLSIVRNVCRNHGGDVQVWSASGEGSTFTLQLPRHAPELEEKLLDGAPNREGR